VTSLKIFERSTGYVVGWCMSGGEEGLVYGPQLSWGRSSEDAEVKAVEQALASCVEDRIVNNLREWQWSTLSAARAALKKAQVARRLMRARRDNRPLEAWEKKALEAGWKPPRSRKF